MNLLAYVIPAIREIRAPLVGGYLWLFAAWLFAADHVPEAGSIAPDSAWAPLHRIADAIGSAGNVVVVSAAALLLGSLVDELLSWVLKQANVHPDRLGDLAEAVPKAKYLVDRALQVRAEAELRLHIALPSVPVTAAFLLHRAWVAAVVSALVVVAMTWHGALLARRAQRRVAVAEARALTRADEMTPAERRREEAHVDADLLRYQTDPDKPPRFALRLFNTGMDVARGVDVDTTDAPITLAAGVLPLERLPTDEQVEIAVVTFVSPRRARDFFVTVRWTDGTGPRSYVKVLRVG